MRLKTVSAVLAGLVTAATLVAVPSGAAEASPSTATVATTAPAVPVPPPITWGTCNDGFLQAVNAQCGTLVVPLDYADPTGPTIRLAVSRILHTATPFRGAVFTNPGGPGGTGRWMAFMGQLVPHKQGLHYDWYGMDPRGVGASRPALSCDPDYFGWDRPKYVPTSSKIMQYWRAKTAAYAKACASSSASELLDHVRTQDNVMDFESLREAIGQQQVTFYGASYGTYIGEVYATMYPDSLKAMILDGVIDPNRVFYQSNLDQDLAFQKTFNRFLAWVGKYNNVYHLGTSRKAVMAAYERLHRKLTKQPAGGKIGPDELDDALLQAAYYNITWPGVAQALSDLANKGRYAGIARLYRSSSPTGPKADNGYAMYLATECTDARWPHDWSKWRRDSWRLNKRGPFLTWSNTWFNAPCRTWPGQAEPRVQVSGQNFTAPVLMTSETLDPATPYAGALVTRGLFPSSRLVAGVGGTSHAVALYGRPCVDDTIAQLLRNGTLPARKPGNQADKECAPLEPPNPTFSGRVMTGQRLPLPPVR